MLMLLDEPIVARPLGSTCTHPGFVESAAVMLTETALASVGTPATPATCTSTVCPAAGAAPPRVSSSRTCLSSATNAAPLGGGAVGGGAVVVGGRVVEVEVLGPPDSAIMRSSRLCVIRSTRESAAQN